MPEYPNERKDSLMTFPNLLIPRVKLRKTCVSSFGVSEFTRRKMGLNQKNQLWNKRTGWQVRAFFHGS